MPGYCASSGPRLDFAPTPSEDRPAHGRSCVRSAALKGDEDCQLHTTVPANCTISFPFEDLHGPVHNGYTLFPFTGGIMVAKWVDFRQIGGEPLSVWRAR